jgi:hypothetical protein
MTNPSVATPPFFSRLVKMLSVLLSAVLALRQPPEGKIYFVPWLDTADSRPNLNDGDRPIKFNQRFGFNASGFQFGQNLPINRTNNEFEFPSEQIDALRTNAFAFLTVYPHPDNVTDESINLLATQMQRLTNTSTSFEIVLRFAPEMNGNWMEFGMQPTMYRQLWIRVYQAVKRVAPSVSFAWAPNFGVNYPYGFGGPVSPADLELLDTNRNGRIDFGDDAYAPFYPGDEYVDWVGLSLYWKGAGVPNTLPPPEQIHQYINSRSFYDLYSVAKNKPYMIAESSSGWFPDYPTSTTEFEMKQRFWRQYLTNATFLRQYPNLKLISQFEFRKIEDAIPGDTRPQPLTDFRITNDTAMLEALKTDWQQVRDIYVEATYVPPPPGRSGSLPQPSRPNSALRNDMFALLGLLLLI